MTIAKTGLTIQSPGRINLIGEHTDYNGGFVMPAAIDKNITLTVSKNGTATQLRLHSLDLKDHFSFDLNNEIPVKGAWYNYIVGVAKEFQKKGHGVNGFDCHFKGDIPLGSGMSSSAALECCVAMGLNELFGFGVSKTTLAEIAQRAEHHYVGNKCGIMDQFASLISKKDHIMLLDCRSLEYQLMPLDLGDYEILVLNTNVSHALADSAYNTRRQECEEGVALIQKTHPEVQQLRDVPLALLKKYNNQLFPTVYKRCKNVILENQRVLDAFAALKTKNLTRFGQLMYQSHYGLQHDYEVSCPELDFLVDQTQQHDFILGARMMGGGFGGCTINIIHRQKREHFVMQLSEKYQKQFNRDLSPYTLSIEGGARVVENWEI